VSFTVTERGTITDFRFDFADNNVSCVIGEESPIDSTGAFTAIDVTNNGGSHQFLEGKFDGETTLSGTYSGVLYCNHVAMMNRLDGNNTWTAEWKSE